MTRDELAEAFSRRPATDTSSAALAKVAAQALGPILDEVDDQQGPSNYEEDNFEAGWHAAIHELRQRLGLGGTS